ncbi:MAG: hypothetical protein V4648_10060 [Bacteroidota bacterium]
MNNPIVKQSYLISIIFSISGAFMKLFHVPYANVLLGIGIIATIVFIITGIMEVQKSNRIRSGEKLMWSVGFIMFSGLAGLVYIASARKRII